MALRRIQQLNEELHESWCETADLQDAVHESWQRSADIQDELIKALEALTLSGAGSPPSEPFVPPQRSKPRVPTPGGRIQVTRAGPLHHRSGTLVRPRGKTQWWILLDTPPSAPPAKEQYMSLSSLRLLD